MCDGHVVDRVRVYTVAESHMLPECIRVVCHHHTLNNALSEGGEDRGDSHNKNKVIGSTMYCICSEQRHEGMIFPLLCSKIRLNNQHKKVIHILSRQHVFCITKTIKDRTYPDNRGG